MIRLRIATGAISLTVVAAACSATPPGWHGSPYESPTEAPGFTLTTITGELLSLEDLRGDAALLFFGYTHCPDVCPPTLHTVAWIYDQLGDQAESLRFLFITIDPERDTPEVLSAYLKAFDPRFTGLLADRTTLEATALSYGVAFFREGQIPGQDDAQPAESYLVSHTSRLFLIGPEGELLTNYSFGTPREEILADIRQALQLHAGK